MSQAAELAGQAPAQSLPSATRPSALVPRSAASANTGLQREVLGFVNSGRLGDPSVGYTSWNFALLSTVVFFGLQVNSGDGALVQTNQGWSVYHSSTMSSFVSAAHAAGTKVIVSINLHDFGTSPTNQVCQGLQPSSAQVTIYQSIQQMQQAGIDGININYEGTDTICANGLTSRSEMVTFTKNLRAAMPTGSYLVIDTYSGSAEDNLEFFDVTGLAPFVDAFFVMAYDMDDANYGEIPLNCTSYCFSPISPLNTYRFNVTKSMSQYTALVSPSKVILGQPYYGRRGCVSSLSDAHSYRIPGTNFVAPTYSFAATVSTQPGVANFTAHRDPQEGYGEWDTWYDSDWSCNREQYFDDVVSLGAKYDLVNAYKLRGVGLFTLDYGGGAAELWSSLAVHFACPGNSFFGGDFNGDGKSDLAAGGLGMCVLASTGSALSAPAQWATVPFYGSKATLSGDVTGDGKTDLVAVSASETFVMASTGTDFGAPRLWASSPFYGQRGTFLADVNGDGKADLVAVNGDNVWVMLSNGSGFAVPTLWSSVRFFGNVTTVVGDINGDGKADLVAVNSVNTWVMTSTGSAFAAPALWSNTPFYGNVATLIGDVSGDHKADLIAVNSTNSFVMTSGGSSFAAPVMWSNGAFYGSMATIAGDVNGDGKVDLVAVNSSGVWVALSTGSAFSAPASWLAAPP
jgi:spore germination protein YaaH